MRDEEAASAPCNGRRLRTCQKGTCYGAGDSDGGVVRDIERALRTAKGSSEDKIDRDHADLLRCPHGKRGQPRKARISPTFPCSLMP